MKSPLRMFLVKHVGGGVSALVHCAVAGAFAAACLCTSPAHAVTIDWVTVGNPGNANDTWGYGAVNYEYRIMTFEFRNSQYAEFLNAVAQADTFSLYASFAASEPRYGITQSGTSGSFKYGVKANMGDKPMNIVSWFDAARVANWLHNGQGSGSTETGAYTLVNGQISGTTPTRNPNAKFFIPTEDEWYKAAYHKGGSPSAGYWDYATQSDGTPDSVTADSTGIGSAGSLGNFANYQKIADWNGSDGNVTSVGTNGRPSAYGAFDMNGNVYEWNDLTGAVGPSRGYRGGSWNSDGYYLWCGFRGSLDASTGYTDLGFRLASLAQIVITGSSTFANEVRAICTVEAGGSARFDAGFAGYLTVNGGTATMNSVVASESLSVTDGTLRLGASNRLSDSTVLTMSGSGTFDLGGGTDTIGSLSMSGSSSIANGTLTAASYALGGGTISGNLGSGTLTNTGVTALNGGAAVSVLNVNSGTLTLGSAGRLTNNPAVTGSSSAVLVLGGAETIGSLSGDADISLGSSELTVGSDGTSTIFAGGISGSGRLRKTGNGSLTLTGSSSFSGGTTIAGGTLSIGKATALGTSFAPMAVNAGALQTGTFSLSVGSLSGSAGAVITTATDSGTRTFTTNVASGTFTYGGGIQDNGEGKLSLTKTGAGVLVLSGSSAHSGGTTISGGTLSIGSGGTTGWITGNITNNAALSFNRSDAVSFSGTIGGSGAFLKQGLGTLTLAASNSYTGGTTISGGTLALGNANALGSSTSAISLNAGTLNIGSFNVTIGALSGSAGALLTTSTTAATRTLTTNVASGTSTYAGTIADNGAGKIWFAKSGAGTLTLSGSNSYTGGTVLSAGVLSLANESALGSAGTISFTGGTLRYSAANTTDYSGRFGTGQSIRIDTNGQAVTFASALSGTSGLIKTGDGLLTLSGNNTFTGQTIIAGGTLQIGGGGSTGAIFGSVLNNASLAFNRATASTYTGVISGSGTVIHNGVGSLTLGGSNSYLGGTILNAGSLVAMTRSAFGTGAVVVNSGTLNLASLAIANQITNNGGTIINAANYGGTQTVAGPVSMSGTIGGSVNVAATGELKGSGVVFNGPVSLATGAQHSPGSSPGSQTFTAGLAYSAGSSLNWELIANTTAGAGTNYDFLSVTGGSLTIDSGALLNLIFSGSGSTVSWSDSFWSADRSWTIIDASAAASSTGEFSLGTIGNDSLGQSLGSVRPRASFALDQSGSDVVLTFSPVPEPSTYCMAIAGIGCGGYSMWRRRKRGYRQEYGRVTVASLAFVAACLAASPAHAAPISIDWVTVGDPGNAADTTGYGSVGYSYQIGKYEITIQQYTDFLNAVDPGGTNPYSLYNNSMGTNGNIRGILFSSGSASGQKYSPIGSAARPITYVSWFDAARFANWMQNGQGSGSTETGAYTMSTGQITAASRTGGVNTYTLAAPSTLSVGDQVAVTGLGGTAFNVRGVVTSVSGSQFTMANSNSDAIATGTGSMTGASATAASNAQFYIPTENEWYKAAYYSPVLNSGSGGYYTYATQSNTVPGNTIGSGANQANYDNGVYSVTQSGSYSGSQNYLTDVGAFTNSASYYGTFDQSGNVLEWNEVITGTTSGSPGSSRGLRGGDWNDIAFYLSSSGRSTNVPSLEFGDIGFRLASPVAVPEPSTWVMGLAGIACGGWGAWRRRKRTGGTRAAVMAASLTFVAVCLAASPAHAAPISIDWVTVGNASNANDTTGYGAVNYEYRIGKYEVTIRQYTDFLNAVDPGGTNPYGVYNFAMGTDGNTRGIAFGTGAASGQKYSTIGSANRPITLVSWFDAARFANWMHNGQGAGSTETGAYTLVGGQTSGTAPARNPGAQFYIPTENEWYKAAYYSPVLNSGLGGYYDFAPQSDTAPGNTIGGGSNQANYMVGGVYSVTQSSTYDPNQNYLTEVGAFTSSGSYYGTFDQSGNVMEWNDLAGVAGESRGYRGGSLSDGVAAVLSAAARFTTLPSNEAYGFRLASPVAVPEPSTYAMTLAGIACGGYSMWRRRKRVGRPRLPIVAASLALALACLAVPTASATPISATVLGYDLVNVGNPGNAADTTGYGSVGTVGGPDFWIGKNHVTIGQYRDFLTAVATLEDPRGLWNASMDSDQRIRGIQRTGSAGAWVYTVVGPNGTNPMGAQSAANRPITYVSWFDSARFANWMANGKPTVTATGSAALAVIDNGAYNLGTATSGSAPAKNTTNPNTGAAPTFSIPTENEWYKAAYYSPVKGGPGTPGYYTYGTQSDTAPGNGWDGTTALATKNNANQANYYFNRYAVTGTTTNITSTGNQNVLTDVGTFTNSASYYGAFDMSGNVFAWNDLDGTTGSSRGLRGGNWGNDAFYLSSSGRYANDPSLGNSGVGFRLASPVPEPATLGMASGGALCACGWWVLKRRRRART